MQETILWIVLFLCIALCIIQAIVLHRLMHQNTDQSPDNVKKEDLDKLREQMRPDAERQVKTRLALEKIAALENIAVSEEETEAEYGRLAEMYNMEADKVREVVAAEAIAEDLKVKKAIELVREKAVITEVEKTDAE